MTRTTLLGTIALTLLATAACSSEKTTEGPARLPFAPGAPWPKFRADAEQTGRSALVPKTSGGTFWELKTEKGIFSSAVIGPDGTTYIGSADRTFYAIAPNGTVKWKVQAGEVIDSSALLDDRGRVYFGAGDGKLRALDAATGAEVWTYTADDPRTTNAFINWFEGNVALAKDGSLLVPNDNFRLYSIDRDTGAVKWRAPMPDQTWSSPAIDTNDGMIFIGNNNVLPTLGRNTFALAPDGTTAWSESTLGSVAASPMIAGDKVIVGAFDGWLRAYAKATGELLWSVPTRDHIYASPGLLSDGTIIQPSADGTVYALAPEDGRVKWTFDIDDPIRSSPAIDGEDNIYFGGGDGRLWVLAKDGTLRWSMKLVTGERNDLNGSPSLGPDGIVIAGESGQIFGVPWDFCLRDEAKGDGRCTTVAPPRSDTASLVYVTAMGATEASAPPAIDPNEVLTFRVAVREKGASLLATLDAPSIEVTTNPPVEVDVRASGDGKFVTLTPKTAWPANVEVSVEATWLRDHGREGLRLTGGAPGGTVSTRFTTKTRPAGTASVSPAALGKAGTEWELARVALPMPTLMPSYNQIGFDSLHWLLGMIEREGDHGIAWMIGAKLAEGENRTVVDPTTRALFPLEVKLDGDLITFASSETLRVEVMNAVIPFDAFRISARVPSDRLVSAKLAGASVCATIPFYGQFLQKLGLCNPQTDELVVVGGAELRPIKKTLRDEGQVAPGFGNVNILREGESVKAMLDGSNVRASDHVMGLLLVDAATGKPVTLDYGIDTTRTMDAQGNVTSISVPLAGRKVPAKMRAHVLVDTRLAATKEL